MKESPCQNMPARDFLPLLHALPAIMPPALPSLAASSSLSLLVSGCACIYSQLEANSELQLPMWLALPLAKRRHVELQLPKAYGSSYRNALRAGANVVPVEGMDLIDLDLRQQSDFYFDIGVQLSQLVDDEADLGGVMLTGFAHRFHRLLEASLNVTSKVDSSAIKEKLTLRERKLFDAGRVAAAQYAEWKDSKSRGRIEQSALAANPRTNGKKRSHASSFRSAAAASGSR